MRSSRPVVGDRQPLSPVTPDDMAARAGAVAWARAIIADPSTVFLDTETTGLGRDAEAVEVAVVGVDGSIVLDTLVRPAQPIPPEASAIHGILDVHVDAAPGWS